MIDDDNRDYHVISRRKQVAAIIHSAGWGKWTVYTGTTTYFLLGEPTRSTILNFRRDIRAAPIT